ncbi:MAG TPA: hypothetical protein VHX44_07185 [Planctomycetota bacterium]|nr:hypothetical protein [Planctomycetota bacterium]
MSAIEHLFAILLSTCCAFAAPVDATLYDNPFTGAGPALGPT